MKRILVLSLFNIFFIIQSASAQFERGYADLVDELLPSVVSIATSQTVERQTRQLPELPEGHPFNDMFDDFFGNQMPKRENLTGLGSGFIISDEGYVVTNNHVISGADQITVIFNNGIDEVPAELVGTDPKTDIAVLKIDPSTVDIQSVNWGDSDLSRVGDIVLAIGNPLGLGGTVTSGIISSINRDIGGGPYVDFIQTDAPINRGNSGGPLFNLDGEVIGVNTAIYSPSGGSVGIGFAIPSELAKNIVNQLQDYGKTIRGWLGVRIQSVTPDLAESLGLDKPYGALVASTIPGSPAEKAGIQAGDIVLDFDNKEVTEMRKLPRFVADSKVDKPVNVVVWRNEKKITLKVVIAEMKEQEVAQLEKQKEKEIAEEGDISDLGIKVSAITDEIRLRQNIPDEVYGLLVTGVSQNSDAEIKGIRPGDIIQEVDRMPVRKIKEFQRIISDVKKKRKGVLLLVNRQGNIIFTAVKFNN